MFKEYINKLSKIQLFELYGIIISCLILFVNFYSNYLDSHIPKSINKLQTKRCTTIHIINRIENISKRYQLNITNIQSRGNNILLYCSGNFNDIVSFLDFVRLQFDITTLKIYSKDSIVYLEIKFNKVLISNNINRNNTIKKISNPFIYHQNKKNISKQPQPIHQKLKLNAIINNEVIINNKWYKQNDKIYNFVLIKIQQNYVILQDQKTKKQIILEIYQNDTKTN
jgi:hypothetical protein